MNIFRSYKRSRFFLLVNIIGLSIGLAGSIMLVLFVINELSYDKHFANNSMIVRLLTVTDEESGLFYSSRNLRNAYAELPDKVSGVEAAVQFYDFLLGAEVTANQNRFQNVDCDFHRCWNRYSYSHLFSAQTVIYLPQSYTIGLDGFGFSHSDTMCDSHPYHLWSNMKSIVSKSCKILKNRINAFVLSFILLNC